MIKVLIVDDEKLVCQLIKSAVDWQNLNMEVVAEAHNGFEALEMIEKYEPRIVITDIRMPGMDGIALLEKAREKELNCDFIVVSGYQDFEYAQKAIKHGVENYILKPIDEDELMMTLYKIAERIETERDTLDLQNNLSNKLVESSGKLKEHFIRRMLNDGIEPPYILEDLEKEFDFGFSPGKFRCLIFRIDSSFEQKPNPEAMNILLNKLMAATDKVLEKHTYAFYGFKEDESVIYIVNYSEKVDIKKITRVAFPDLRSIVSVYSHYLLTVGEGSEVERIRDIRYSYLEADKAIKYRLIAGLNKLIDSESLKFKNECVNKAMTASVKRQFVLIIESADYERVDSWINDNFKCFTRGENINPQYAFDFVKNILKIFYSTLAEMAYDKDVEQAVGKALESISWANTMPKMAQNLIKHITEVLERFKEEKENSEKKPIMEAKEFIGNYYMKNINLSDVANAVYLNSNYFSTLFKKESGMSFIDYLTKHRVESSKALLKDGKIKIALIAKQVGYQDPKHFSKTFKKNVGITPNEYRKLYN